MTFWPVGYDVLEPLIKHIEPCVIGTTVCVFCRCHAAYRQSLSAGYCLTYIYWGIIERRARVQSHSAAYTKAWVPRKERWNDTVTRC